jgi:hypothetical protein
MRGAVVHRVDHSTLRFGGPRLDIRMSKKPNRQLAATSSFNINPGLNRNVVLPCL